MSISTYFLFKRFVIILRIVQYDFNYPEIAHIIDIEIVKASKNLDVSGMEHINARGSVKIQTIGGLKSLLYENKCLDSFINTSIVLLYTKEIYFKEP